MSRLYRLAVPSTDRPHDAEPELLPFGEQSILGTALREGGADLEVRVMYAPMMSAAATIAASQAFLLADRRTGVSEGETAPLRAGSAAAPD